jgi:hypothetical protein
VFGEFVPVKLAVPVALEIHGSLADALFKRNQVAGFAPHVRRIRRYVHIVNERRFGRRCV